MSEETLFRIGGCYRQNDGRVVRLRMVSFWSDRDVMAQACDPQDDSLRAGARSLIDGRYPFSTNPNYEGHLLPGELHNVNGEWLPIDSDAEMLALQTRPQHVPASCEEGYVNSHDHTLKFTTEGEKVRPPLPGYGQRTPFNNFDGFTVTSDCAYESQPNTSFAGLTLDGCGAFVLPKQAF